MKKLFKLAVCGLSLLSTFYAYADSGKFEWEPYATNVYATSNGEEKKVISKIDGKNLENKIITTFEKDNNGNILMELTDFKLGKIPFLASVKFIIPKDAVKKNDTGEYIFTNIQGDFKVLSSKRPAFISGNISSKSCSLKLIATKKNKKLEMELSYSGD